ncbi:MAG: DUF4258 domain-containing protein [Ginsengibacter sp.]
MNRRKSTLVLITIIVTLIIIKLVFFGKQFESSNSQEVNSFRNTSHLTLIKHAKCRMECRHITLQEIKEILQKGNENTSKSGEGSKGDKTYALEGYSSDRQHIRVVVAPEVDDVVVITCIDLDKDWPCNCN